MEGSSQEPHLRSENSITYECPYPIYAMAFSSSAATVASHSHNCCLPIGNFIEELNNQVDILSFDEDNLSFKPIPYVSFNHPYPPTKLMFHLKLATSLLKPNDILASSGDYPRVWEVRDASIEPIYTLNNSKTSEFCAPLTLFD